MKPSLSFKLFSKLCLFNLLFYRRVLFYFQNSYAKIGQIPNNFVNVSRLNLKNIFAEFGKYINRLYYKFLFAKSIYLFKCFYIYFYNKCKGGKYLWKIL